MTFLAPAIRFSFHSTHFLVLLVFAGIAGCGSDESSSSHMVSPPGWVLPSGGQHAKSATLTFIDNGTSSCIECHGADLSGGTSNVSCYANPSNCHHGAAANWVASSPAAQEHGAAAKRAPGSSGFASCQICHGEGFSGGGSLVTCFTCHGVNAPHSASPWRGQVSTHVDTDTLNVPICVQCHYPGSPNNPPNHPDTPAPSGTPPGCFNNTLCHGSIVPGSGHAVPYHDNVHYNVVAGTFDEVCGTCHDLSTPSTKAGPACNACHTAGSPLTVLNCASCHGSPPDGPAGAVYPNIPGTHAAHIALGSAGSPIGCDICHNGLGTGTLTHYNRANALPGKNALHVPPGDVAFLQAYNAKSGTAAFSAGNRTCSTVICHGGQTTPDWRTTDAIDIPNACLSCHVSGTTQYNSYNSGSHGIHIVALGLSASMCKLCHDAAKVNVSGHFQNLATPAFEQLPSETLLPALLYDGNSCNPRQGGLSGCHNSRRW